MNYPRDEEVYVVCTIYEDMDSNIAVYRDHNMAMAMAEFYKRLGEYFYDTVVSGKLDSKEQYQSTVDLSHIALDEDNELYIVFDNCELYVKKVPLVY